jgi:hypothetical protein
MYPTILYLSFLILPTTLEKALLLTSTFKPLKLGGKLNLEKNKKEEVV